MTDTTPEGRTIDQLYQDGCDELAHLNQTLVDTEEALRQLRDARERLLGQLDMLKLIAGAGHGALTLAAPVSGDADDPA